jgi:hypothetical protein
MLITVKSTRIETSVGSTDTQGMTWAVSEVGIVVAKVDVIRPEITGSERGVCRDREASWSRSRQRCIQGGRNGQHGRVNVISKTTIVVCRIPFFQN